MKSVHNQLGDKLSLHIDDHIKSQIGYEWEVLVWDKTWLQVFHQVRIQVWTQVKDQVWLQVLNQVEIQTKAQIKNQVEDKTV